MLHSEQILPGWVYDGRDEIGRYVVEIAPADGRKQARVTWRRPGPFADRLVTETMPKFLAGVVRLSKCQTVEPAHRLPDGAMAAKPTQKDASNG